MHHATRINAIDLTRRIEEELEAAKKRGEDAKKLVLATDADGTIWDGDVGLDLFESLLESKSIRDEAREGLARDARALGVDDGGDARELAERLYVEYSADRYPLDRAFAMMTWVFAGFTRAEMAAFAERVLDHKRLEARIRPAMRSIAAWAKERGLPVYVVSASSTFAVRYGVRSLGVSPERVVAMTPAQDHAGVLTADISGPVVYGKGKIEALHAALPHATMIAAFGDSAWDSAMLSAAKIPILVAPAPGLVEKAREIHGAMELDLAG